MRTVDQRLRDSLEEAERALKELEAGRPREFRSDPSCLVSVAVRLCAEGIQKAMESARLFR